MQAGSTDSGAPLVCNQLEPSPASSVLISLQCASKLYSWRRDRSRRSAWTSPPSARAACSTAISVGSPDGFSSWSRRALLQLAAVSIRALSGACGSVSGAPSASSLISPAQVQIATGCIRFSVSVPVLSVQITSVLPSVSTELIRFTTAPRRARSVTATASDRVITGSSPSGTMPAKRPTANVMALRGDSPVTKIASGTNAIASATATLAINHETRRTC